jgi:protein-S-isoprenylcysteine O-methyltransferase Ste14
MRRPGLLVYGIASYVLFLGVFLYAVGFVGNLGVPKSIDSAPRMPITQAVLINSSLLLIFALQHSIMARPTFKAWWMRLVPQPAERSTYVLLSSLCLIVLFVFWEPVGGIIWDIQDPFGYALLLSLFVSGWMIVLITTFLINHFDLFGLRQVWLHYLGQPYRPLGFMMPAVYQHVRHPLYVGWLIAFWATPTMTAAHLLFAIGTSLYILVAIQLEERNLLEVHGEEYRAYRRNVPMLLPRITPHRGLETGRATVTPAIG